MCIRTIRRRLAVYSALGTLVMAFATIPALADGDDQPANDDEHAYYVERNAKGERTGTIEEESPDYLVKRNNRGERTGTIERDSTGQWILRDTRGRRLGTVDRQ